MRTLSLLAGLSEDQMARRPQPDRWSAGELADHLLRTELLWRGEVAELVALVRAGRLVYQHPLIGLSDAVGLLRVIIVHEQRHQAQLEGILEEIGAR